MRKILPLLTLTPPTAGQTVTLFNEAGVTTPSLLAQGMRELTVNLWNDQACTLHVLVKTPIPGGVASAPVKSVSLAAGTSAANTQHFDLTGFQGLIEVQIVNGGVNQTLWVPTIEVNDEVQTGGCAS